MPHLPTEEEAPSNLTEKVAKNPSSQTESTASHHDMHDNEHGTAKVKATAQDHASKGPAIPDEMPEKASKEELKARAAELNK
ncbi:MAG: hypothetical protein Q9227_007740 [Pyrenula ochraceoflavens]